MVQALARPFDQLDGVRKASLRNRTIEMKVAPEIYDKQAHEELQDGTIIDPGDLDGIGWEMTQWPTHWPT